jgi:hypothetical protein
MGDEQQLTIAFDAALMTRAAAELIGQLRFDREVSGQKRGFREHDAPMMAAECLWKSRKTIHRIRIALPGGLDHNAPALFQIP